MDWPYGQYSARLSLVSATPELAIETAGLTKVFGHARAVDSIDLAVPAGCVYGFLGPNGAGKTTTIRILATLLRPDAGVARVLGHDVVAEASQVRRMVSLTSQFASLDEELSAVENLVLLARLLGYRRRPARARAAELLDGMGLAEAAGRQVARLSGGMRRRLDIAASLIVTPQLLFLDEPTTGLDPHSRHHVWDMVRALVDAGTTVLLTTQYLEEVDRVADQIAVIDHGKIIAEGTTGQLKRSVGAGSLRVRLADAGQRSAAHALLGSQLGVPVQLDADPAALSATMVADNGRGDPGERVGSTLTELSRAGITVDEVSLGQPTLDEVFLALTGQPTATSTPGPTEAP